MHLITIIAFAALLWFNSEQPMNLSGLSRSLSVLAVILELLAVLLVTHFLARRTLRKLEDQPDEPNEAQHEHHVNSTILQFVIIGLFIGNLILTSWAGAVNAWDPLRWIPGLGDLVVLSPFVVSLVGVWIIQYPVDRAIRELALNPRLTGGHPVHPVWTLRQYLNFNVRYQLLTIAIPMTLILIGDDLVAEYKRELIRWGGGLLWMPDAVMGIIVCGVFLFAPVMLRYTWTTEALPPGALRNNLERIAGKMNLKYREILIWHSQGMVVNAAVMGLFAPVRYVLISDGLLESMSDKQIEAVFGHESGHIKCWHIPMFIVFATLTMLLGGVLIFALQNFGPSWLTFHHVQLTVGLAVVLMWGFAFGWLSHKFEHQADISGAMSITPTADGCRRPCLVHSGSNPHPGQPALCATAAQQYGAALRRVAALNGILPDERGWRHPSIQQRITFLKRLSEDLRPFVEFKNQVKTVNWLMVACMIAGLAAATYIYRDQLLPKSRRSAAKEVFVMKKVRWELSERLAGKPSALQ